MLIIILTTFSFSLGLKSTDERCDSIKAEV